MLRLVSVKVSLPSARYSGRMIWFFERRGEHLQCEIRIATNSTGCELVWTASGGPAHVERSNDPSELVRRRRPLRAPSPLCPLNCVDDVTTPERVPAQRIVVRRGQVATFELLERTFAHDPSVEIVWDRRVAERRQAVRPDR